MRTIISGLFLFLTFITRAQTTTINKTTTASIELYRLLLSHQYKTDTIPGKDLPRFIEDLYSLNIYSGAIYFSGAGFANVVSARVNGSLRPAASLLERCRSGTKISFEKVKLKNKNNLPEQVINKSFVIK